MVALLLLQSSPAPAADLGDRLRLLQREDLRVATVFLRLTRAATPFCRILAPQTGLVLHALIQYAPEARPEARRLFGLGDAVAIAAVAPGGAAARAGLAAGDDLVAVGGSPLPAIGPATRPGDAAVVAERWIAEALRRGPATVTIARSGVRRDVTILPEPACDAVARLLPSSGLRASTDGHRVSVTTGLVEFAGSDDALAFLLGHEIAHVALGHRPDGGPAAALGLRAGAARRAEAEADRLGLRIAARAGYDPHAAVEVLTRLAQATGLASRLDPRHPAIADRIAALRAQAAELPAGAD